MARTRRPDKAPSKKDTQKARELVQMLAHRTNVFVKVRNKQLQIPNKIVSPLIEAARLFAEGHSVAVVPTDVEIIAQEPRHAEGLATLSFGSGEEGRPALSHGRRASPHSDESSSRL